MKHNLRQSFNTGLTFGFVHVFLVLIGFNTLIGSLFAKLLGAQVSGSQPPVFTLIIYTALLGIWAGLAASKKTQQKTLPGSIAVGTLAGVSAGLIGFLFSLGLGWFLVNRIDFRQYLAFLSFDFIKATLFNLSPLPGALLSGGIFSAAGALGGLLNGVGHLPVVINRVESFRQFCGRTWQRASAPLHGRHRLLIRIALLAVLAALIILLPLEWGSYWNYVAGTVGLYVILGLGLNIIVGLSGQLVLGYIAFFAIGAYTMALLNAPIPHNLMWGFWPAVVLGVLLAAAAGLLLGLPLMRLRGDYLAIVTLGFGVIIRILL